VKAPLHDYMRVGILHAAAFPASSADELITIERIARDDFFGAIEITPVEDMRLAHNIRRVLDDTRTRVDIDAGAGLYRRNLSLSDPHKGAIEYVRSVLDHAAEMHAERVNVVSGPDPREALRQSATATLTDTLLTLCEYARAAGDIKLGLKMADRAVDKHFLIGPTLEGARIARAVRGHYPDFGVVLNLGHLPLLDEDPEDAVETAAPVLSGVHIGNCVRRDPKHPRYGDSHPRFGIDGGEIGVRELAAFLRALLSISYLEPGTNRLVAFEVRPGPAEDPEEVIADSCRVLCEAWARV
jgi:sugar phosphate isomerase/epimerase